MQDNEAWIEMFRRIPVSLHDALALGLTTGSEIVVQKIVTLDPRFMIIRGRLAGTQDTGRVVVVPYNQLTFAAVQRDLKDSEVESMFGQGAPVTFAETPMSTADETPRPVEDATVIQPAAPVNPPKRPEQVSKGVLLAKLRDRLKESGK
jgi:hypothetical protein